MSIDSGKHNITVNNILTGFFNTERLKELNSEKAKKFNIETNEVFQKMSEMVPMKRIGEPEEFGYLVAFLSSEYANYINGDRKGILNPRSLFSIIKAKKKIDIKR